MDIIKFPIIVNNYSSLWSVYEKSYKNSNYLDEYKFDDTNINNYIKEYNKIVKIQNNFYKIDKEVVLSKLFRNLNNLFILKYYDYFKDNILNFIKSERVNDFMYCFLKSLSYDEGRILLLSEKFPEDNFMNDLRKINQIILEICKLGNMDNVIDIIYYNISNNISKRFIKFVSDIDLSVLSNLLKKVNLFKKFYVNFNLELKASINKVILEKIITSLNNNNISSIKLANNIIDIFNFLLTEDLVTVIIADLNYSLLLDYLNASIYFWILENNYINVEVLIKYSYNYLPKLEFLEYYKNHLQNRALIIRNYDFENKCFNTITKIFYEEELNKIIYELRYILDDISVSNLCNDELFNLNVNVKYNFQETNFDLKKCNVLVCSNNLWNDNKTLYDNINYIDNIGVYDCILNKFYESKFSKKRKLSISYEESTITINLWNNNLTMPLTYYNIFYKIGESESKVTLNYLKDYLNYDSKYLLNIIDIFKSKNLVKEVIVMEQNELKNYINKYYEKGDFRDLMNLDSNYILKDDDELDDISSIFFKYIEICNLEKDNLYKIDNELKNIFNLDDGVNVVFVLNDDLENLELNISLRSVKNSERKMSENVEYDRNLLLDSFICKLLKKEKELKYGKLLLILRNNISKFFVPSEREILHRLERLNILGYIEKYNDFYKYIE